MDRLSQLRGSAAGAGGSRDSSLDASSAGDSFLTANDTPSKYYSLTEDDSAFDIAKDVSLASATQSTLNDSDCLISNLSPIGKKDILDGYKIGKQIEAANILSGGVDIFDDNDNSYDGNELVIDDNVEIDDKSSDFKSPENSEVQYHKSDHIAESTLIEEGGESKETEVVLQIDGKNVDAINIGNGLYLYRKEGKTGQEELAAVQIIDDDQQQPSFKFLKVRENAEGNLEVYEEIEIEVPKDAPVKGSKPAETKVSNVPVKDINKPISYPSSSKVTNKEKNTEEKEAKSTIKSQSKPDTESNNEAQAEPKTEFNLNCKMVKFSESRKSPLLAFHSTPNKEGIPLTKTMVDQQLHPNRHSDNIKKTIEVNTENCKHRLLETPTKNKDDSSTDKSSQDAVESNKKLDKNVPDIKEGTSEQQKADVETVNENTAINLNPVSQSNAPEKVAEIVNESVAELDKKILPDIIVDNKKDEGVEEKKLVIEDTGHKVDKKDSITPKVADPVKIAPPITKTDESTSVNSSVSKDSIQIKPDSSADILNKILNDSSVTKPELISKDVNKVSNDTSPSLITNDTNKINKVSESKVEAKIEDLTSAEKPASEIKEEIGSLKPLKNTKSDKLPISVDNKTVENSIVEKTDSVNKDLIKIANEEGKSNKSDSKVTINKDVSKVTAAQEVHKPIPVDINNTIATSDSKPDTQAKILFSNKNETKADVTNDSAKTSIPTIKKSDVLTNNMSKDNKVLEKPQPITQQLKTNLSKDVKTIEENKSINKVPTKDSEKTLPVANTTTDEAKKVSEKTEAKPAVSTMQSTDSEKANKSEIKMVSSNVGVDIDKLNKNGNHRTVEVNKPENKAAGSNKINIIENKSKNGSGAISDTNKIEKKDNSVSAALVSKVPVEQKSNSTEVKVNDSINKIHKQDSKLNPEVSKPNSHSKDLKTLVDSKELKVDTVEKDKGENKIKTPKDTQKSANKDVVIIDEKPGTSFSQTKSEANVKKDPPKVSVSSDTKTKSINNNLEAVPFGKWTEANRQDFLNKIKESKVPVNSSNTNQIKQPNDLNRRDVLKKFDSQRQSNASVKTQEALHKNTVKAEPAAFSNKNTTKPETKVLVKTEVPIKPKPTVNEKSQDKSASQKPQTSSDLPSTSATATKKDATQRKEINNQDLINKSIEGIFSRTVPGKGQDDVKEDIVKETTVNKKSTESISEQAAVADQNHLDAIEKKMNELHGIPFVERPSHQLPSRPDSKPEPKLEAVKITAQKIGAKIPKLLPLSKNPHKGKDGLEHNSEDTLDRAPVTGDTKHSSVWKDATSKPIVPKESHSVASTQKPESSSASKTDKIITEREFDKFARRNSVTYENRLTVNFEGTEPHHVVQTLVPKDNPVKKISRNEQMLAEAKAKSPHKHQNIRQYPSKHANKLSNIESQNKSYSSKLQQAYQTALTTKRHIDSPITILEDKPVKVVFVESASEFAPIQLNVQGRDLSPMKKQVPEADAVTVGTCDSLDSDILEAIEEVKDETKIKSKHQRKQVLTPVENPDLELIEPGDLGIEASPKKKRRTDDKGDKSSKTVVPKKSYLLGRTAHPVEKPSHHIDLVKLPPKETVTNPNPIVSAIDNLVKAAELLENQAGNLDANLTTASVQSMDTSQSSPVKRGRGRPRKNPPPDGSSPDKGKAPSPQKKPRLIDAKISKHISSSEDSSDDEMVQENWTMGKINENIVCPICYKLFRSENVVFKHVKHCTGPSPNRSDSDKRSPRRSRLSRESESRSRGSSDDADLMPVKSTPKKRKSNSASKSTSSSDDVLPAATTSRDKPHKHEEAKKNDTRKSIKPKILPSTSNLECEFCGKTFRQLSYLVSHRLQHKKEEPKATASETQPTDKSVFSCETCKKEFRKLHHLVQHRPIHNLVSSRVLRKSSSEHSDSKLPKAQDASKSAEDQSAGFRCEPCDKSFRKLHHLVEHRETHDGINRQRSNSVTQDNPEKPAPPPQCDVCKKTFRKQHHLVEHNQQHLETSSEKSDDQKSVKSSLSTKDIIHECNLCYMVFPNEHSLNKHSVNCLRKRRQSAAKQAAAADEKVAEDGAVISIPDEIKHDEIDEPKEIHIIEEEKPLDEVKPISPEISLSQIKDTPKKETSIPKPDVKTEKTPKDTQSLPKKNDIILCDTPEIKSASKIAALQEPIPAKIKKVDEIIVIEDTPKKKVPSKEKVASAVTKRQKSTTSAPPVEARTSAAVSSDDDEVRYMFNPDFKVDETDEGKNFMKVRAKKRSSLQIERPNSKDLVRRRSLLQHPPKIPRLRAKSDDIKPTTQVSVPKPALKTAKLEQVPSTDSDDSDVKYSFPKAPEKPVQAVKKEDEEKPVRRKTMAEKRKSLGGIAKRKSLGKAIVKPKANPAPVKPVKRRTNDVEHRCDCGQLFSSAALLARHASLAHTPPRVRRRRSPPPPSPPDHQPQPSRPLADKKPDSRKSSVSTAPKAKQTPKSKATAKSDARKSTADSKTSATKTNRVHRGVPVPDKLRKAALSQKK